jgi:hypothetical protein
VASATRWRRCRRGLSRHEVDDLYGPTLVEALSADVTVLTGPEDGAEVLPADTYRRLTVDIRANGGRVIADLSAIGCGRSSPAASTC